MEKLNPYEPVQFAAQTRDSDDGVLHRAISLMGTTALVSLLAMLPLMMLQGFLPPWLFVIALVGFFVPMGINVVLLLVLVTSVFFDDANTRIQRVLRFRAPPWEKPRRVSQQDAVWYQRLLDRLQYIEQIEAVEIPTDTTLWRDEETDQLWLCSMETRGFAVYDLFVPTTMDELRTPTNPFGDRN